MTIERMITESTGSPEAEVVTGYLTRREAAARCRVPVSTFDAYRRQNRVPYPDAQMGKHMLWRASTIEAFLEAGGTRDVS